MKKSFRQMEKYRKAKLSAEQTAVTVRDAPLRICLVFPNSYYVGMSNLAVHSLYALLNSRDDTCCERSFFEEPLLGYSLESGFSLSRFDIVAFSVSFELDYPKILNILHAARIPARSAERNENHPIIIAGGPCVFSNPEPIADFIDVFAVGEGEELVQDIIDSYLESRREGRSRISLFEALSQVPGVYIPSFYEPVYDENRTLTGMLQKRGSALPVAGRIVADLDRYPCSSVILTADTEFSNMFLIELGRGCRRGCKYCSACYTYHHRSRSLQGILHQIEKAGEFAERIGLITSDLSEYPHRQALLNFLVKKNKAFSVSSIRADSITDDILEGMKRSAQRTLTLAPEVASDKLRSFTGKKITADALLAAIERALHHDIYNFKLYFMIGFSKEEDEDAQAIVGLATRVHEVMQAAAKTKRRIGKLTLSVNPFVPKPFTPLEAEPFADQADLTRRIRILRNGVARIGNASLLAESPRIAKLQCAFSRGDRRAGFLVESAAGGQPVARTMRQFAEEIERFTGPQPEGAMRPWSVIRPPSGFRKKDKEGLN